MSRRPPSTLLVLGALALAGPSPRARAAAPGGLAPTRAVVAAAIDPDPHRARLERNLRLSARSQRGDRFLIAGRLTGSMAGMLLAGGIAMLVVHHVTVRDDRSLLVGGAVLTGVGAAANIVGSGLSFHGMREIEAARRGELPPTGSAE